MKLFNDDGTYTKQAAEISVDVASVLTPLIQKYKDISLPGLSYIILGTTTLIISAAILIKQKNEKTI